MIGKAIHNLQDSSHYEIRNYENINAFGNIPYTKKETDLKQRKAVG